MLGLANRFGHVQQGLRGNATPQQANAAKSGLLINQRDLHAQVSSEKCGGITARSGAKNAELSIHGK
jgi:hypothetical protein